MRLKSVMVRTPRGSRRSLSLEGRAFHGQERGQRAGKHAAVGLGPLRPVGNRALDGDGIDGHGLPLQEAVVAYSERVLLDLMTAIGPEHTLHAIDVYPDEDFHEIG